METNNNSGDQINDELNKRFRIEREKMFLTKITTQTEIKLSIMNNGKRGNI